MNNIATQIEELMAKTMGKVADAAKNQDLIALEALTRRATELKQMKEQMLAIQQRLNGFVASEHLAEAAPLSKPPYGREIRIGITQGMINQNLLTLTEAINRGTISAGEVLAIEAEPSGRKFKTVVMANGNKLQERGEMRKFYAAAGVGEGDIVILREMSPGQWKLRKGAWVENRFQ